MCPKVNSLRDGGRQTVALLPMKGHSERVPGKNVRDFCGKPLFRWILDTLLSLPEISSGIAAVRLGDNLIPVSSVGLQAAGQGSSVSLSWRPQAPAGSSVFSAQA